MRRLIGVVVLLLVLGGLVGGAWWYVNQNPQTWFWLQDQGQKIVVELGLQPAPQPKGLFASGFIEADEASVTTNVAGRIVALTADEGDEVTEGQVLVRLDESLLVAQIGVAEAEVAVAEANLAQVKAGVRQETLDQARAVLSQAEVAQSAALVAWKDAQAMLENPQELELAITAARAQLGVLTRQVQQAQAVANSAQVARDLADEVVSRLQGFEPFTVHIEVAPGVVYSERIRLPSDVLPAALHQQATATYQSWEAWTGLDEAKAQASGVKDYVAELLQQKADPLSLQAQTNAAESRYNVATAAVGLAQAQVDGLRLGATPEQIAAVEAQVGIAEAALEALEVQLDKLTLAAPISGLVLERPVHVGEVAQAGAPLMTLADLDRLTLTIYVPEDQLGKVQIGQIVSVTVDSYPDRTFPGTVTFIANEAEFTPKNVQTREERVNMVFAVKVELPNPDHALKPGMPADAVIPEASTIIP